MKKKNNLLRKDIISSDDEVNKDNVKPVTEISRKKHSQELVDLIWDYYDRKRKKNENSTK